MPCARGMLMHVVRRVSCVHYLSICSVLSAIVMAFLHAFVAFRNPNA